MNIGKRSEKEVKKDRKMALREKKVKEGKKKVRRKKKERLVKVRKAEEGELLREVTVKIGLERINTQEGIMVEMLLDGGAIGLVMSLEFAKKQRFKSKKIERLITSNIGRRQKSI